MTSLILVQTVRLVRRVWLGVTVGLALLALAMMLLIIPSVQAANRDVCPTCTYKTIQAAIIAANNGDVIRVAQGIYTGTMIISEPTAFAATVIITKSLTLRGGFNADFSLYNPRVYTTTIDGELQPNPVVAIFSSQTTIDGFAIVNGRATQGAGAYVWGCTNSITLVTVSNNYIAHNQATDGGGGIYLRDTLSATITGNDIYSNTTVNGAGGGLLTDGGIAFVVSNNQFRSNFAGAVGGGFASGMVQGTIISNTFDGNSARDWSGGGIYINDGTFEVYSNTVTNNHAHVGGGIGVAGGTQGTTATLSGNLVMSNSAQDFGGGIAVHGGGVYVVHNVVIQLNQILSNTAQVHGGGICVDGATKVVIQSNQMLSNTVHSWMGSGLSIKRSEVLVDSNLIAYNVHVDHDYGNGPIGIYMEEPSLPVSLTNNVIVSNTDKGIWVDSGVYNLQIVNNTIAANRNEGIAAYFSSTVSLVRNNLVAYNGYCGVAAGSGAEYLTVDHNNVWQNGGGNGNYCDNGGAAVPPTPGAGSLSSDPLFVDAANGNYQLRYDSPSINKGIPDGAPTTDYEGMPRDSRPDLGAYEWGMYRILIPLIQKSAG